MRDAETSSFQLPLLLAQQGVGGCVRAARDPGLVVDLFEQTQLGQPLPAPAHLFGCHSQPPGQFGLAVLGPLDLGPVELHIHAIQSDGHAFPLSSSGLTTSCHTKLSMPQEYPDSRLLARIDV
ncbi:hypothetical protein AB0E11_26335 [Streptomyces fradiae]|uniref:hypothetical protein n=1 Tax=Streptomyces fradiae TaxID=1906 RepID=UPI0033C1CF36